MFDMYISDRDRYRIRVMPLHTPLFGASTSFLGAGAGLLVAKDDKNTFHDCGKRLNGECDVMLGNPGIVSIPAETVVLTGGRGSISLTFLGLANAGDLYSPAAVIMFLFLAKCSGFFTFSVSFGSGQSLTSMCLYAMMTGPSPSTLTIASPDLKPLRIRTFCNSKDVDAQLP